MARRRRLLRADAYIRLWSYMPRDDRLYAMCYFARIHQLRTDRLTLPAVIRAAIFSLLRLLGLSGTILAGILEALDAISDDDILGCDNALLRGPSQEGT